MSSANTANPSKAYSLFSGAAGFDFLPFFWKGRNQNKNHINPVNPVQTMSKPKKLIRVVDKGDDEATRLFWKNKSPEERLSTVEFLREQCYVIQGYKAPPSITRTLHVLERKR